MLLVSPPLSTSKPVARRPEASIMFLLLLRLTRVIWAVDTLSSSLISSAEFHCLQVALRSADMAFRHIIRPMPLAADANIFQMSRESSPLQERPYGVHGRIDTLSMMCILCQHALATHYIKRGIPLVHCLCRLLFQDLGSKVTSIATGQPTASSHKLPISNPRTESSST